MLVCESIERVVVRVDCCRCMKCFVEMFEDEDLIAGRGQSFDGSREIDDNGSTNYCQHEVCNNAFRSVFFR